MPFADGTYVHSKGFTLKVEGGEVYLSPEHPMSMRLSELFDTAKWAQAADAATASSDTDEAENSEDSE